jgi:hypothetical protein
MIGVTGVTRMPRLARATRPPGPTGTAQRRLAACRALAMATLLASPATAADPPPPPDVPADLDPRVTVTAPGVRLDLVVEHPGIVTPTGIDVDAQGRIWIVACHTHFRPTGYAGPVHDEVLVFAPDGTRHVYSSRTEGPEHPREPRVSPGFALSASSRAARPRPAVRSRGRSGPRCTP